MRHKFAREGYDNILGRFFEVGSIKFDDNARLPLLWGVNHGDPNDILGSVSDIQREEDGWITAEVNWGDSIKAEAAQKEVDSLNFTIGGSDVISLPLGGTKEIIKSCRLRYVFMTIEDPWADPS